MNGLRRLKDLNTLQLANSSKFNYNISPRWACVWRLVAGFASIHCGHVTSKNKTLYKLFSVNAVFFLFLTSHGSCFRVDMNMRFMNCISFILSPWLRLLSVPSCKRFAPIIMFSMFCCFSHDSATICYSLCTCFIL